ncbi:TPA: hypothetical protein DDW35_06455 [Candidatus Sumerlaeota bacterium]|nr:hypothetical protein [Candidatus Sumerlaeota bacterium]
MALMSCKRTVLVALTDSHHEFYRGIVRYANAHNWDLATDIIYTARIPHNWQGDGVISYCKYWSELANFLTQSPLPKVELTSMRSDLDLPRVDANNMEIGQLAAEHLIARNFKNFAYLSFTNNMIGVERLAGFQDTLQQHGKTAIELSFTRKLAPSEQPVAYKPEDVHHQLLDSLKQLPRPVGIFCYNDCIAATLLEICQNAGWLVPEEVAIIGVDNHPIICENASVPLSSVINDLEGMAYAGAALLDRLISGEKPPAEVLRIRPKGVVTRKSTDILAVHNTQVAKALQFIWDNYQRSNLSVNDIADAINLSRRSLERAFLEEMRHSIQKEILRTRMEKVQQLLLATNMTMVEIAECTGFTRPRHLFRVFRSLHNMSPREWREKHPKEARLS